MNLGELITVSQNFLSLHSLVPIGLDWSLNLKLQTGNDISLSDTRTNAVKWFDFYSSEMAACQQGYLVAGRFSMDRINHELKRYYLPLSSPKCSLGNILLNRTITYGSINKYWANTEELQNRSLTLCIVLKKREFIWTQSDPLFVIRHAVQCLSASVYIHKMLSSSSDSVERTKKRSIM